MILVSKVHLKPTEEEAKALLETIKEANRLCNFINDIAWESRRFDYKSLNKLAYFPACEQSTIHREIIQSCIRKVSQAYKLGSFKKRFFKPHGALLYNYQQFKYEPYRHKGVLSLQIMGYAERPEIPFVIGTNEQWFPVGEKDAKLVYEHGNFFIHQAVDIPDVEPTVIDGYLGVDLGLNNSATLSNGVMFSGQELGAYRKKRHDVNMSILRKGTKSAKKLLHRIGNKESITATNYNHFISKRIVEIALQERKGIVLEDLTGIRNSSDLKNNKNFRAKVSKWGFYQLRKFIEYKAQQSGVPVILVDPKYTSQTCSDCNHIGTRKGISFKCNTCGLSIHADVNAARNLSIMGLTTNQP